jgi:hypothetical protein
MRLNLCIDGEEQTVIDFNVLIHSLLELGERKGLIKFRIHTVADDDIVEGGAPEILRDSAGRLKSLTPEIETYICKLHLESGYDAHDISRELRINADTARKILGKHGFNNKRMVKMDEDQIHEAIRMYTEDKLSAMSISKKMGRSPSTICKHLQAAGVMTRLTPAQVSGKNIERSNVRRLVLKMPEKKEA